MDRSGKDLIRGIATGYEIHIDLVKASGKVRQILPIDLPWIPGHEFSGVVEQIGGDVAAYAPGDAVFGTTSGMGAYAEYLAVKAAAQTDGTNLAPRHLPSAGRCRAWRQCWCRTSTTSRSDPPSG